jgi:hypothetical protein
MSYGTQQSGYSITPTIAEVDHDLADVADSTLERYSRDLDTTQFQHRTWEALPLAQRKAIRAQNELAKRQNAKERADKQAAEDARADAQQQERIDALIADYKARARGAWIGDQASFDSAWPDLLRQWQIDQARATMDQGMAAARAHLSGF